MADAKLGQGLMKANRWAGGVMGPGWSMFFFGGITVIMDDTNVNDQ